MDVLAFVPQFGGFLYTIASFVIALSVIVAVHEYGHYIVGRWSGIHAEVFSLGFGPVLWSRVDKHGTRWQIAALPFGGYVKFLGDADAASGKDDQAMQAAADDPAALRRTMHGAPLWARTATVAAGPVFNFVMSAIIFTAVAMSQGIMRDPLTIGALAPLPGVENGLREGDELISAGGLAVPSYLEADAWEAFREALPQEQPLEYQVRRGGSEISVSGPYLYPPYVRGVVPRSAAADAGLQPEDVILAMNGAPVVSFDQLKAHVEAADGKVLVLDVWRDGQQVEMALAPRRTDEPQPDGGFATRWRIGIIGGLAFEPATESAGFGASLAAGTYQVWAVVETSLSGLKHMITGAISTCNLSGPIGIAETSGAMASQGAESFIRFIAVLSTAVGLLNLFPVPALDGGHLMFYAYEAVAGRPPSDRAVRVLMSLGIAIVLSLMVFALGNDLFC
ncbi:RIP metalloprotease RseP [Leisingera methylohalidivorans]|uniref:Zinc metalloprotease n=1 Tax=Leisingera methylohalidivorans DSM 14336 TaxID=999552 RepID=V9VUL1_9RHOB|nr:RIP metalloprotease RseP [Leisingera methylohalidivorans]AHD01005.1 zinc metalloprotease [Leisingera methylohalidivorans DSM 14336]